MEYKVKDRKGNIIPGNNSQKSMLDILYKTIGGSIALRGLTSPVVSRAAGVFCNSALSTKMIPAFIKSAKLDLTEYEPASYGSYNEFFTRKIRPEARPIDMEAHSLVSPCDSKLTVYKIDRDSIFEIKGVSYHVDEFLRCGKLAKKYEGGYFCIFRLEVSDYHRYIYFDNGTKSGNVHINGVYHTVNPVALEKADIYRENTREFTILHTENFGDVIQAEVGAMLVGRIKNHHQKHRFRRGDEKGMFEFGGSTVVLIFPENTAEFDEDIIKNTADGFETVVKMGEKIGRKAVR
ncbi:MAG: phosphatidylserine decarboxylase [Porcipelethomonas sp.]